MSHDSGAIAIRRVTDSDTHAVLALWRAGNERALGFWGSHGYAVDGVVSLGKRL